MLWNEAPHRSPSGVVLTMDGTLQCGNQFGHCCCLETQYLSEQFLSRFLCHSCRYSYFWRQRGLLGENRGVEAQWSVAISRADYLPLPGPGDARISMSRCVEGECKGYTPECLQGFGKLNAPLFITNLRGQRDVLTGFAKLSDRLLFKSLMVSIFRARFFFPFSTARL